MSWQLLLRLKLGTTPAAALRACGGGLLDQLEDGIRRFFDGEQQARRQVDGGAAAFDLDEDDVRAVQDDLATLVDAVQFDQWHVESVDAMARRASARSAEMINPS